MSSYTEPHHKFIRFMNKIEKKIRDEYGVGLLDLPDENYRIMYDEGYTVEEIVNIVINNNYLLQS